MEGYGFTPTDCKVIKMRMQKRLAMRDEFLKAKSNPHKHAAEAGYVFDPAVQRYLSMKATQLQYYQLTFMNGLKSFVIMALPMIVYGTIIYFSRSEKEQKIRNGELKYRERTFKFQ